MSDHTTLMCAHGIYTWITHLDSSPGHLSQALWKGVLEPSRTATYVKYPYLEYPHRQSALAGFDDQTYFLPANNCDVVIIYEDNLWYTCLRQLGNNRGRAEKVRQNPKN